MKRLFIFFLTVLTVVSAFAQLPPDGYYRVQNYGSKRWAYLCDCTGFLNYTTQNADVEAIQLWMDQERTLDDPASVMYVESSSGDRVNLKAQGTSLHDVIGHYAQVSKQGDNQYWVYASQSGITKYLGDARTNSNPQGKPGFNAKGEYIKWSLYPVNESDNYLGITPTFHAGGKHYAFYYVSFPFKKLSTGLKFYYVSKIDTEKAIAVVKEITKDIIPAATPMIVECPSTTKDGNKIMPVTGGGAAPSDNLLAGVYFCNNERPSSQYTATRFDASSMRALCVLSSGKLGYNTTPDYLKEARGNGGHFYDALPANSSYLKNASGLPTELTVMTKEEYDNLNKVEVSDIVLSRSDVTMHIDDVFALTATVVPENATDKSLTWTSDKPEIASVDQDGVITAHAFGDAEITVKANDGSGVLSVCVVRVVFTPITSITLSQNSAELYPDDELQLVVTLEPENATYKTVKWQSEHPEIATVDQDGKVKALSVGQTVITVETQQEVANIGTTCIITVKPILVNKIDISQPTAELLPKETLQLTAIVMPENATDKNLEWSCDKPEFATVDDNGLVTAVAPGEAVITVKAKDGSDVSATCNVKINPILVTILTLSQEEATLKPGNELQLTATVEPEDATNKEVKWESDTPEVAQVDQNGKVIALAVGNAVIKAIAIGGNDVSAECRITVEPILVTKISLSKTSIGDAVVGDHYQLIATIEPEDATNKSVMWKSEHTEVATVDEEGIVIVVGEGTTVISATTTDGTDLTATCTLTAVPATIPAEEVKLDVEEVEIGIGREIVLVATVLPENASTHSVNWSSDKPEIAAVDQMGKVVGLAEGEAVITVTTVDGTELTASCKVKVVPVLVETIELDVTSAEIKQEETLQLTATVTPNDATNKELIWKSEQESVATVDANGLVTAVGVGETVITVMTKDGSELTATCQITVTLPDGVQQVTLADSSVEIYSIDGRKLNALRRGVNIVRMADGSVRRIAVK